MSTHTSLRDLRLRLKLSLDELGRRARVERSRLSRAERGYTTLRDDEVARIAMQLGVAPSEFTISAAAA